MLQREREREISNERKRHIRGVEEEKKREKHSVCYHERD